MLCCKCPDFKDSFLVFRDTSSRRNPSSGHFVEGCAKKNENISLNYFKSNSLYIVHLNQVLFRGVVPPGERTRGNNRVRPPGVGRRHGGEPRAVLPPLHAA